MREVVGSNPTVSTTIGDFASESQNEKRKYNAASSFYYLSECQHMGCIFLFIDIYS